MSDPNNPFDYPVNPTFGQGIFRRHIRLENKPGIVTGAMEDCNHGFCITLHHDGQQVTRLEGDPKRIPLNTCHGALQALKQLEGMPLGLDAKTLNQRMPASDNCTHWLDLAILCYHHALRDEPLREYKIAIPDEDGVANVASVHCNDELVHDWLMLDWAIQAPESLAGNTLFKGFASWANQAFESADETEAAFVLQKGYFVSRARRFDIDKLAGEPASNHSIMHGACYSYSEPRVNVARRTAGSVRDFTDSEAMVLQFK